jgi:hypothetical protein
MDFNYGIAVINRKDMFDIENGKYDVIHFIGYETLPKKKKPQH